jgi:hypothetical protein
VTVKGLVFADRITARSHAVGSGRWDLRPCQTENDIYS